MYLVLTNLYLKSINSVHMFPNNADRGGDFPKIFSTFVSITNGELYLQGFEHSGDRVIHSQKSHRNTQCFLHLFRCYTGSTRAALGPHLEDLNNTINTPYVGLRKRGLHILEHSVFVHLCVYTACICADICPSQTMLNIHSDVSIETDAIAPRLVWHCLMTPKMCNWAF